MHAKHEQQFYGRYYAEMGLTEELVAESDDETFVGVWAIEQAIGEELESIAWFAVKDDDRLSEEERATMTRDHIKVRRRRARGVFEMMYQRKGDARARVKSDFRINYAHGTFARLEEHENWADMEPHAGRIEELICEWRDEFTRIVPELCKRAGRALPSVTPKEFMSRYPMVRDAGRVIKHLDAYEDKAIVVRGHYVDLGEQVRPFWLQQLAESLDPADVTIFAMLMGAAHGQNGVLAQRLDKSLQIIQRSLKRDTPKLPSLFGSISA